MISSVISEKEAEGHFAELLDRVQNGEQIAITRAGVHVAVLNPVGKPDSKAQAAYERILARREVMMREGRGLSLEEIIAGKNEGRR